MTTLLMSLLACAHTPKAPDASVQSVQLAPSPQTSVVVARIRALQTARTTNGVQPSADAIEALHHTLVIWAASNGAMGGVPGGGDVRGHLLTWIDAEAGPIVDGTADIDHIEAILSGYLAPPMDPVPAIDDDYAATTGWEAVRELTDEGEVAAPATN